MTDKTEEKLEAVETLMFAAFTHGRDGGDSFKRWFIDNNFDKQVEMLVTPSPSGLSAEEAATAYGESFKTGEWFETIRIEAFKEGAKWASEQHCSMAK